MCLIAMAWGMHPDYPLVIAANRDEWYARPTAPLAHWRAHSGHTIVSGRDLQGGGTWMGFSPSGRFAMLTNVRKALASAATTPPSRGQLVVNWLCSSATAHDWAAQQTPAAYEGFNLIVGDWASQSCHYLTNQALHASHLPALQPVYPSNQPVVQVFNAQAAIENIANSPQTLSAHNIIGLSNAALDTPWPKTLVLTAALRSALAQLDSAQTRDRSEDGLLKQLQLALQDTTITPDGTLPRTGVPIDLERNLSSVFVRHPIDGTLAATYGTRTSLCALLHRDGLLRLQETTHSADNFAGAAPSSLELSLQWPALAV